MGLRRIPKGQHERAVKKAEERIKTMEMLLEAHYNPTTGLFYRHDMKSQTTKYWDFKGKLVAEKTDAFKFMQVPRQAGKSFSADLWQEKLKAQMEKSMGIANHIISDEFHRGAGDSIVINRRTTK